MILSTAVLAAGTAWADVPMGAGVVTPAVAPAVDAIKAADYESALQRLKPLAEKGDVTAQVWLSQLYTKGQGVKRDRLTGETWCLIGLAGIRDPGPPSLSHWETERACAAAKVGLTAKQAARAQRTADVWRPADDNGARTYQIYFDFEISNLTRTAQDVADAAALNAAFAGARTVRLVGHADTAEDDLPGISQARALAVKAEMVRMGVSKATDFTAEGVGSNEPAFPVGPGVREPLDRFVSVTVQ
ncbi:MAG TPA: OmpA family protein [Caulobacteraceae bacterium]|nr:OmpA family protein [Caulobacteraceae bacterium]